MLNRYRQPLWMEIFAIIIELVKKVATGVMYAFCLGAPFIALWLMVKMTPFFLSLR